jgi:hypothetical protein
MVSSNGDFSLVSLCALKAPEHRTQFLLLFLNNNISCTKRDTSVAFIIVANV